MPAKNKNKCGNDVPLLLVLKYVLEPIPKNNKSVQRLLEKTNQLESFGLALKDGGLLDAHHSDFFFRRAM
jgi:hypothetical protein